MILNLVYDASVGSAPVGFTAVLDSIVSFFQTNFKDPVTVNIAVGYGEVNGQALSQAEFDAEQPNITPNSPLSAGALGSSVSYLTYVSYSEIRTALAGDASSGDDASAVSSLPVSDPTGGAYWMTTAEAKAIGLRPASGHLDGYIGFSSTYTFDYDNSNGVSAGQYDFFGVVAHEVTEVMGRQVMVGQSLGGTANSYELLDLFHFSAPGVRNFLGAQAGYFSLDNGATNLNSFNTNPSGDYGDWATSAGHDSFRAFGNSGFVNAVTAADMRVMDVLGWNTVPGPPPDTTPPVLLSAGPADNAINVAPTSDLVLNFSENVRAGSGNIVIRKSSDGSAVASIAIGDTTQIGFSGSSVIVNPAANLAPGTHYYVTVDSGAVRDNAGNSFAGISSSTGFDFTTGNTRTAAYDFNADGNSDVLVQNGSGQAAVWLIDVSTVIANVAIGANPGPSWHAIGAGDFNGDGRADVLWQNDSGQAGIWMMNGTIQTSGVSVGPNPGPSWHVKDAGDFNADGKADILWQNDNGQAAIWTMNGTTQTSAVVVGPNPGPSWHVEAAGDFNADGKADILWQNDDGRAAIWTMNGTAQTGASLVGSDPGSAWHIKGNGDFNADGNADILWQNDNGQPAIWLMNGTAIIGGALVGNNPGPSWHVEGAGDYNGDGKADIFWQNDNGQGGAWLMDGTAVVSAAAVGDNLGPSWHIDWA